MIQFMATFLFSPYLMVIIGLITQLSVMFSRIWRQEPISDQIEMASKSPLLRFVWGFFPTLFQALFGMFGLIFFDIGILWLAGTWGYIDWLFQIPSVILGLIIAFKLFSETVLRKPYLFDIILWGVVATWLVYILNIASLQVNDLYDALIPLWKPILLAICGCYFSMIWRIVQNPKDAPKKSAENQNKHWPFIWDCGPFYTKKWSLTADFILFCILFVEVILKLYGYSMLTFFLWL